MLRALPPGLMTVWFLEMTSLPGAYYTIQPWARTSAVRLKAGPGVSTFLAVAERLTIRTVGLWWQSGPSGPRLLIYNLWALAPAAPMQLAPQEIRTFFVTSVTDRRKAIRIRGALDYERHRNYIHQNPVRRGLARTALEYPYSSVFPGTAVDPAPQR